MVEKYVVVCCWATMCSPSHLCIGIGIGIGAHCSLVEFVCESSPPSTNLHWHSMSIFYLVCTQGTIVLTIVLKDWWSYLRLGIGATFLYIAVLDIFCSISIYIPYLFMYDTLWFAIWTPNRFAEDVTHHGEMAILLFFILSDSLPNRLSVSPSDLILVNFGEFEKIEISYIIKNVVGWSTPKPSDV